MIAVEQAARGVIASIQTEASYLLAAKYVADRYKQIFARVQARHLRRVGLLYVPADVTAGTATFTRDSDIVTGNAAAQAAWTPDLVNRFIRGSVAWYQIKAVEQGSSGTQLRLLAKYGEDTSAGAAYHVISRLNALEPGVRWIGNDVVHQRSRKQLTRYTLEILDQQYPERPSVSSNLPYCWAEIGDVVTADGQVCKALELYPYCDTSEVYAYVIYPTVPDLGVLDVLPPEIDEHVVREGALIDIMRYNMGRALAATPPRIEEASVWRNEYRAQETRWEKILLDAMHADSATDDKTFILQSGALQEGPGREITNARDYVYSRWP